MLFLFSLFFPEQVQQVPKEVQHNSTNQPSQIYAHKQPVQVAHEIDAAVFVFWIFLGTSHGWSKKKGKNCDKRCIFVEHQSSSCRTVSCRSFIPPLKSQSLHDFPLWRCRSTLFLFLGQRKDGQPKAAAIIFSEGTLAINMNFHRLHETNFVPAQ